VGSATNRPASRSLTAKLWANAAESKRLSCGAKRNLRRPHCTTRAVTALHAAVASVAGGIVPGGGVAYVLAGEALRGEGEEDTIMWLAARAVLIGLETPFRLRAAHAGLNPDTLLVALRNDPTQAFDQTERKLVPFAYGPVDAARVVQRAIREAGRTACDLLRMAL